MALLQTEQETVSSKEVIPQSFLCVTLEHQPVSSLLSSGFQFCTNLVGVQGFPQAAAEFRSDDVVMNLPGSTVHPQSCSYVLKVS